MTIVELLFYSAVSFVSGLVAELIVGDAIAKRIPRLRRSYSDAYGRSFFCSRCPGVAKARRAKLIWYLYRCRDCGAEWRVLKAKPWVRRGKRERGKCLRRAI